MSVEAVEGTESVVVGRMGWGCVVTVEAVEGTVSVVAGRMGWFSGVG